MRATDRRVDSSLALGLGLVGLLLDFSGYYSVVGVVFGLLGLAFVLFMPRGGLRRSAFWLNLVTVAVAAAILLAFFT